MSDAGRLRVVVDGKPLPDDEARAFWERFSAWMEEHAGDLAGFARAESLASVHPEMHGGAPVLVGSRTAAQKAYASAPKRDAPAGAGARPVGAPGKRRTR
jgi:hypothetical protein